MEDKFNTLRTEILKESKVRAENLELINQTLEVTTVFDSLKSPRLIFLNSTKPSEVSILKEKRSIRIS
jgi:hypothetical protein